MQKRTTYLTILITLYAAGAHGSGFQIRENSAAGLGRAYAGSGAVPEDAAVIFNNPAAMTLLDDTVIQADLAAIDLSFDFTGGGTDTLGRPLTGNTGGDAGDLLPVPAAYFATRLGKNWRLGVSLTSPFGLRTEYDEGWVGRYHALTSELVTGDLGLSLSYDITDDFSIGGSAIVQYADAELSRAIDFGAILADNPAIPAGTFLPQSADGRVATGDDYAPGWSVGALWRPVDGMNIGLSYRSEIDHNLTGNADFEVPTEAATVFASLPGDLFTDTGGRADLTTPAVATLSLHTRLTERVDLMADLSRTFWSSFDELVIRFDNPAQDPVVEPQKWSDTWFASVGSEFRINSSWTLRGGIGYDETPTNDTYRSPRIPDADRRWLSVGATWYPAARWDVDFGYARLLTDDAEISNTIETGSTLDGRVDADTNLFAVSAAYRF